MRSFTHEWFHESYNVTGDTETAGPAGNQTLSYNYGSKLAINMKNVTLQYDTHAGFLILGYTVK